MRADWCNAPRVTKDTKALLSNAGALLPWPMKASLLAGSTCVSHEQTDWGAGEYAGLREQGRDTQERFET